MDLVEFVTRIGASIGAIAGAIATLGGLMGAIDRASQVPRARRRVIRAAELKDQAPSSLRGRYAALHREQSARYLALVESRIDRERFWAVLAAVIALLSAFVILIMMAWNGGNAKVWPETLATVTPFAIAYGVFLWITVGQASSRSRDFVRSYGAYVGSRHTDVPAPGEELGKLIQKRGEQAAYRILLAIAVGSSASLVAIVGHVIGRNFTESGLAMKESDGQWVRMATILAILVLFIVVSISVRLLFPRLPRDGESLRYRTLS